ncbi:MAG: hypothetical protein IPP35_03430 [Elusimicrobia bacterium]|nr:hypothetical protein [Elusimicrobiota bacterium]
MMRTARALWLAGGLLGAMGLQVFHRHSAHDGGLFAPHEDCSVCLRSGAAAGGALVPSPVASAPRCTAELFWKHNPAPLPSNPLLHPFGRAPPFSFVR